ncbi:MAG: hypothetical protein M5U28_56275 [Sandaracinaceae bacterium]|nr:hypothetical protein [Sandaracinaceae bacterium]
MGSPSSCSTRSRAECRPSRLAGPPPIWPWTARPWSRPTTIPEALAAAALILTQARETAGELGRRGADYVGREHSAARYLEAMRACAGAARV